MFEKFFKSKMVDGRELLRMVEENNYIETFNRKENLQAIIEKGKGMEDAYSYLAMAFSYAFLGAKYRKNALDYYERYMQNPIHDTFFSDTYIFSEFGKLYEAEYDFDSAERCYKKYELALQREHPMLGRQPNVLLGRLYLKEGTQKAVDYWKAIMNTIEYKKDEEFKHIVDVEYKNAVEKHNRGYVYKPRKKVL